VLQKTGIEESVIAWTEMKNKADLARKAGIRGGRGGKKVVGIPKLDDANDAGGKHSRSCTLILTEGDSAKTLAVAGLAILGRDKFGVYPLKGKFLNVRDATHKQVVNNKEI